MKTIDHIRQRFIPPKKQKKLKTLVKSLNNYGGVMQTGTYRYAY